MPTLRRLTRGLALGMVFCLQRGYTVCRASRSETARRQKTIGEYLFPRRPDSPRTSHGLRFVGKSQ